MRTDAYLGCTDLEKEDGRASNELARFLPMTTPLLKNAVISGTYGDLS